jgi:ABC-type multidrug transport system permease subunit
MAIEVPIQAFTPMLFSIILYFGIGATVTGT